MLLALVLLWQSLGCSRLRAASKAPLLLLLLLLLGVVGRCPPASAQASSSSSRTVRIGSDPDSGLSVGWTDGICYGPVSHVLQGDTLEFAFTAHDVHKMASKRHHDECDFSDAVYLAGVGMASSTQPFRYTVTEQDVRDGTIYFACSVGAHCTSGRQRLTVNVDARDGQLLGESAPTPISRLFLDVTAQQCQILQNGGELPQEGISGNGDIPASMCSEPIVQTRGRKSRYFVSCLSAPATLTPGGVINEFRVLHYPYPTDRRVKVGLRTWEFVSGDPDPNTLGGVTPVPVNQLYIHHLSGSVVLGQGSEGIRRSEPDAPFPDPYGLVTGDEGDVMGFHLIDLREVGPNDWLACIECRCADGYGTYLDGTVDAATAPRNEFGVATDGGVPCCTNCTALTAPTVDYRMRYNVSYEDIPDDDTHPVSELLMVTADISPVVGKNIEFDVPQFDYLPDDQKKDGYIQRLERVGAFKDLFRMDFFGVPYNGPDEVMILRCVGHLHVAAIGMWLEDAETGETICEGMGKYGTDPDQDKGFLTAISVDNFDDGENVISADQTVRLVTEYNATTLHTGVMGMWFMFVSGEQEITRNDADLNVNVCTLPTCDAALIPPLVLDEKETCFDALPDSPACRYGNMCDCEEFVNAPESTGCGGVYSSNIGLGDIAVNDMCAEYCGCPEEGAESAAAGSGDNGPSCVDLLAQSPACKFGNLCDCETLVNAPESTGCDGVYSTQMGDLVISEICPNYCDACPEVEEGDSTELLEASLVDQLEESLLGMCKYATDHCRLVLSNMYTCDRWRVRETEMDAVVQTVLKKHGQRLALKHSKLGHPSLHRNDEEREVKPCVGDSSTMLGDADFDTGGASSLAGALLPTLAGSLLFLLLPRYL